MLEEIERTVLHRGQKFDLERVSVAGPGGRTIQREIIRHPGAVCVLAILDGSGGAEPQLVMIHNVRPAVGGQVLELVAGTLEPGEPPAQCARRELIEEAGYEAEQINPLGTFYTTPGMTDELMHAFVARQLRHVGQRLEGDEDIEVVVMRAQEVLRMIDTGELMDAKSMLTVLLALRSGILGDVSGAGTGA